MSSPTPNLVIGSQIRVLTKFGDKYEGELFAFDAKSSTVILTEARPHSTVKVYRRVIKTPFITDVSVLKRSSGKSIGDLPDIPTSVGIRREKAAIAAAERAWPKQNQGRGVSAQAQALMDLLGRQYACEWKGQDIFVRDLRITVKPPYRTQNVFGQGTQAVDQIKKAVHQISTKYSYQSSNNRNANASGGRGNGSGRGGREGRGNRGSRNRANSGGRNGGSRR